MSEQKRKSKPGYETAYWCCSAEFGEHDLDCPNHVEAAPHDAPSFKRVVTHEQAREAYFKLHNAVYNHAKAPLLTIPRSENDVDVIICDYIAQQEAAQPKAVTLNQEIETLKNQSDDQIDTSDIPETTDWSGAVRGKFYKSKAVAGGSDREMLTEAMILLKSLALSVTWELAPAIRDRIADICKRYEERLSQPAVSSGTPTNLEKIEAEAGWYHSAEFDGEEITFRKYVKEAIQRAFQLGRSSGMGTPPIQLNESQETVIKSWAADDRLWTTQETVEFNLRIFARTIIASTPPIEKKIVDCGYTEVSERGGIRYQAEQYKTVTSGMAKEPTKEKL